MYKPTYENMTAVAELTNLEFREKYNKPFDFHVYLEDYPYSGQAGVFNLVLEDGTDGSIVFRKAFPVTNNLILLLHYKEVFLDAVKDPFLHYLLNGIEHIMSDDAENTLSAEEIRLWDNMSHIEFMRAEQVLDYITGSLQGDENIKVSYSYDDSDGTIDIEYKNYLIGFYPLEGDYLHLSKIEDFITLMKKRVPYYRLKFNFLEDWFSSKNMI